MASGAAIAALQAGKYRAPKRNFASRVFGYDLFISFALGPPPRGTHSYASDLARRLRERDFTVFFSEDEAAPGEQLGGTLLRALYRSRTLVVIANRGTLEDPRWVRQEVEAFTSRHPDRPIVPISVGGALQDTTLAGQTRQWLAFDDKIWLDESHDAVAQGIASDETVARLALAPAGRSSNAKWRWVVRAVVAALAVLLGAAISFGIYAEKESRIAIAKAREAQQNADRAEAQTKIAQNQTKIAESQTRIAQNQTTIAENQTKLAEQQRAQALARQLTTQSELMRPRPRQLILASLLGLESLKRLADEDSRNAVAAALDLAGRPEHLLNHGGAVKAVAISPDHSWIVTSSWNRDLFFGGASDPVTRIWDAATAKERVRLQYDETVTSFAVSPDGAWIATSSYDRTARVWDVATGHQLALLNLGAPVEKVVVSPDGRSLVTISGGGEPRIWDAPSGKYRARLVLDGMQHEGVHVVAISPDSKWLVTGGLSSVSRIWDLATGRELKRLVHNGWVESVAISPDGKWIATGSQDHIARIWDPSTGKERALPAQPGSVLAVAIGPDGRSLITAAELHDGTRLVRWDADSGKELQSVDDGHALHHEIGETADIAISPDGKWLATRNKDNAIHIFDATTLRSLAVLEHQGDLNAMAISPDSKWLVTGSEDRTAGIWSSRTGRGRTRIERQSVGQPMSTGADGKWIATTTFGENNNAKVHLWDPVTLSDRAQFDAKRYGAPGDRHAIAVSPDGESLADYLSLGGTIYVWDGKTNKSIANFELHGAQIRTLTFSDRGKSLVCQEAPDATDVPGTLHIWNLDTRREQVTRGDGPLLAVSPNGRWLVTSRTASNRENQNSVTVLDTRSGEGRIRFEHQGPVEAGGFSLDGAWIATSSEDKTARVWDWNTGAEYLRLSFHEIPYSIGFVGQLLAIDHDGEITFEPWRSEDLILDLCARMTRNLTLDEWKKYIGDEPYRRTCPELPGPEKAGF